MRAQPDRPASFVIVALCLTACSAQVTPTIAVPTSIPTESRVLPTATAQVVSRPEETPAASCDTWQAWPVVPDPSARTQEIFARGQERGNEARAFSKIGDGEIAADWFLSMFDLSPHHYDLGPHQNLHETILHFKGSFGRRSAAARRGFNTERILDVSAADQAICTPGESSLDCELRLHRPAFAILSLGTNQVWRPDEFESGMRRIIEILLAGDVVPILSSKGDNLEGDHGINRIIACLAVEYELPLWNFWAAIQPLPNHGLQPDLEHLTYGITDFDDPQAMQSAWTIRNLTALQVLDAVWRQAAAGQ